MHVTHIHTLLKDSIQMVETSFASESLSGEEIKNVPRLNHSLDGDSRCLDTSSNFSTLISATFAVLYLIFILWNTNSPPLNLIFSSPFSVPFFFLYSHFRFKAGCCAYVRNKITCSHAHALESSEFSTIWRIINCHSTTKFFCAVYRSPNSSDYVKLFE